MLARKSQFIDYSGDIEMQGFNTARFAVQTAENNLQKFAQMGATPRYHSSGSKLFLGTPHGCHDMKWNHHVRIRQDLPPSVLHRNIGSYWP